LLPSACSLACNEDKKTFQDGELVKQAFVTGADGISEGFSHKHEIMSTIQDLQLSDSTSTRRMHVISSDMRIDLKSDMKLYDLFSVQFDLSTDMSDTAQLAVMVRIVFTVFTVKETLKVLPVRKANRS
jgi:hypothetical protein